jgi:hypothetical protein
LTLTLNIEHKRREVILRGVTVYGNDDQTLLQTSYSKDTERQVIKYLAGFPEQSLTLVSKPLRFSHFLPRLLLLRVDAERSIRQNKLQAHEVKGLYEVERISREASWLLQSVQYLAPFRVYPFSGERPSVLGSTGRGATDILVADYFRRGTRKRELANQVASQPKLLTEFVVQASAKQRNRRGCLRIEPRTPTARGEEALSAALKGGLYNKTWPVSDSI